jgi:hypothetical protein
MTDDQKLQLASLISPIILELTDNSAIAGRLEVAMKIIEGMEAEGWIITPPKPKRRPVAAYLRLLRKG